MPLPPEVTDVRVFCGGCLVVGGPPVAEEPGAGRALAAAPGVRAAGRSLVLTDEPRARRGERR